MRIKEKQNIAYCKLAEAVVLQAATPVNFPNKGIHYQTRLNEAIRQREANIKFANQSIILKLFCDVYDYDYEKFRARIIELNQYEQYLTELVNRVRL